MDSAVIAYHEGRAVAPMIWADFWAHQVIMRLLTTNHQDARITKMIRERMAGLESDNPTVRAASALLLSGASGHQDKVLPALVQLAENDLQPDVQHLAAISLSGFGTAATPMVEKFVSKLKDDPKQGKVALLLSFTDPNGRAIRPYIRDGLANWKRSEEKRQREFEDLELLSISIAALWQCDPNEIGWAIDDLIKLAEFPTMKSMEMDRSLRHGLELMLPLLESSAKVNTRAAKFIQRHRSSGVR